MYDRLEDAGNSYGPAFRRLGDVFITENGCAKAQVHLFHWEAGQYPQEHIIHPASLDGLSQLLLAALSARTGSKMMAWVTTEVSSLWISKTGLNCSEARSVEAVATSSLKGSQSAHCSISVLNTSGDRLLLSMQGLGLVPVTDQADREEVDIDAKLSCYKLESKPDIRLLDKRQIETYCKTSQRDRKEPVLFYEQLTCLILSYVLETLAAESQTDPETSRPYESHLQKYFSWMQSQMELLRKGALISSKPDWEALLKDKSYVQDHRERLAHLNAQGKLYCTVGENLGEILRGKLDALELLFKSDILHSAYREINSDINCFPRLHLYLDAMAHQNPSMKILEIGAGTGGATLPILRSLSGPKGSDSPRYAQYHYTDLSSSFFERAKETFSNYKNVHYQRLDVTEDASQQDFDTETFDMVVAANVSDQCYQGPYLYTDLCFKVLHATPEIESTMRRVRQLLKP